MELRNLKKTVLISGSIIIFLYILLGLIESRSRFVTLIILLPLLAWPYIIWKYELDAAIFSFAIGCITIIWFAIDFVILRAERIAWHIPVFIIIAPLPGFLLGWMIWDYAKKKHIRFRLYSDMVKEFKKLEKRFLKKR